jgi:hypothetical protein
MLPSAAWAGEPEVKFRVHVLLATSQGDHVDPQIGKRIREYLTKSFGARYSSFRQLDTRVLRVGLDKTGEMPLPDQSTLGLRFRDIHGEFVKLTMTIKDLRTTIRIRNGGLFFQAGHRYKNGILILAISATLDGKAEPKNAGKLSPTRPDPRPASPTKTTRKRAIDSGAK